MCYHRRGCHPCRCHRHHHCHHHHNFSIPYFCLATVQAKILAKQRLPTMIRKVKFTDFVKCATSPKMQQLKKNLETDLKGKKKETAALEKQLQ